MADPIVAADGVTYQRSAFKKYIAQCQACEFNGPLLTLASLFLDNSEQDGDLNHVADTQSDPKWSSNRASIKENSNRPVFLVYIILTASAIHVCGSWCALHLPASQG